VSSRVAFLTEEGFDPASSWKKRRAAEGSAAMPIYGGRSTGGSWYSDIPGPHLLLPYFEHVFSVLCIWPPSVALYKVYMGAIGAPLYHVGALRTI
jgi:hypothetical protein